MNLQKPRDLSRYLLATSNTLSASLNVLARSLLNNEQSGSNKSQKRRDTVIRAGDFTKRVERIGSGMGQEENHIDYRKYTKYNNGIKGGVYMYKPKVTIWYNVKNAENTLAFYTEKLGFKVFYQNDAAGMVMVKTNSEDCVIGFSEVETVVPSTSSTVFDVENIELAVQTLQQKGVLFNGEIRTIPNITKLATFTDPDGHNLMLSEDLMEF